MEHYENLGRTACESFLYCTSILYTAIVMILSHLYLQCNITAYIQYAVHSSLSLIEDPLQVCPLKGHQPYPLTPHPLVATIFTLCLNCKMLFCILEVTEASFGESAPRLTCEPGEGKRKPA